MRVFGFGPRISFINALPGVITGALENIEEYGCIFAEEAAGRLDTITVIFTSDREKLKAAGGTRSYLSVSDGLNKRIYVDSYALEDMAANNLMADFLTAAVRYGVYCLAGAGVQEAEGLEQFYFSKHSNEYTRFSVLTAAAYLHLRDMVIDYDYFKAVTFGEGDRYIEFVKGLEYFAIRNPHRFTYGKLYPASDILANVRPGRNNYAREFGFLAMLSATMHHAAFRGVYYPDIRLEHIYWDGYSRPLILKGPISDKIEDGRLSYQNFLAMIEPILSAIDFSVLPPAAIEMMRVTGQAILDKENGQLVVNSFYRLLDMYSYVCSSCNLVYSTPVFFDTAWQAAPLHDSAAAEALRRPAALYGKGSKDNSFFGSRHLADIAGEIKSQISRGYYAPVFSLSQTFIDDVRDEAGLAVGLEFLSLPGVDAPYITGRLLPGKLQVFFSSSAVNVLNKIFPGQIEKTKKLYVSVVLHEMAAVHDSHAEAVRAQRLTRGYCKEIELFQRYPFAFTYLVTNGYWPDDFDINYLAAYLLRIADLHLRLGDRLDVLGPVRQSLDINSGRPIEQVVYFSWHEYDMSLVAHFAVPVGVYGKYAHKNISITPYYFGAHRALSNVFDGHKRLTTNELHAHLLLYFLDQSLFDDIVSPDSSVALNFELFALPDDNTRQLPVAIRFDAGNKYWGELVSPAPVLPSDYQDYKDFMQTAAARIMAADITLEQFNKDSNNTAIAFTKPQAITFSILPMRESLIDSGNRPVAARAFQEDALAIFHAGTVFSLGRHVRTIPFLGYMQRHEYYHLLGLNHKQIEQVEWYYFSDARHLKEFESIWPVAGYLYARGLLSGREFSFLKRISSRYQMDNNQWEFLYRDHFLGNYITFRDMVISKAFSQMPVDKAIGLLRAVVRQYILGKARQIKWLHGIDQHIFWDGVNGPVLTGGKVSQDNDTPVIVQFIQAVCEQLTFVSPERQRLARQALAAFLSGQYMFRFRESGIMSFIDDLSVVAHGGNPFVEPFGVYALPHKPWHARPQADIIFKQADKNWSGAVRFSDRPAKARHEIAAQIFTGLAAGALDQAEQVLAAYNSEREPIHSMPVKGFVISLTCYDCYLMQLGYPRTRLAALDNGKHFYVQWAMVDLVTRKGFDAFAQHLIRWGFYQSLGLDHRQIVALENFYFARFASNTQRHEILKVTNSFARRGLWEVKPNIHRRQNKAQSFLGSAITPEVLSKSRSAIDDKKFFPMPLLQIMAEDIVAAADIAVQVRFFQFTHDAMIDEPVIIEMRAGDAGNVLDVFGSYTAHSALMAMFSSDDEAVIAAFAAIVRHGYHEQFIAHSDDQYAHSAAVDFQRKFKEYSIVRMRLEPWQNNPYKPVEWAGRSHSLTILPISGGTGSSNNRRRGVIGNYTPQRIEAALQTAQTEEVNLDDIYPAREHNGMPVYFRAVTANESHAPPAGVFAVTRNNPAGKKSLYIYFSSLQAALSFRLHFAYDIENTLNDQVQHEYDETILGFDHDDIVTSSDEAFKRFFLLYTYPLPSVSNWFSVFMASAGIALFTMFIGPYIGARYAAIFLAVGIAPVTQLYIDLKNMFMRNYRMNEDKSPVAIVWDNNIPCFAVPVVLLFPALSSFYYHTFIYAQALVFVASFAGFIYLLNKFITALADHYHARSKKDDDRYIETYYNESSSQFIYGSLIPALGDLPISNIMVERSSHGIRHNFYPGIIDPKNGIVLDKWWIDDFQFLNPKQAWVLFADIFKSTLEDVLKPGERVTMAEFIPRFNAVFARMCHEVYRADILALKNAQVVSLSEYRNNVPTRHGVIGNYTPQRIDAALQTAQTEEVNLDDIYPVREYKGMPVYFRAVTANESHAPPAGIFAVERNNPAGKKSLYIYFSSLQAARAFKSNFNKNFENVISELTRHEYEETIDGADHNSIVTRYDESFERFFTERWPNRLAVRQTILKWSTLDNILKMFNVDRGQDLPSDTAAIERVLIEHGAQDDIRAMLEKIILGRKEGEALTDIDHRFLKINSEHILAVYGTAVALINFTHEADPAKHRRLAQLSAGDPDGAATRKTMDELRVIFYNGSNDLNHAFAKWAFVALTHDIGKYEEHMHLSSSVHDKISPLYIEDYGLFAAARADLGMSGQDIDDIYWAINTHHSISGHGPGEGSILLLRDAFADKRMQEYLSTQGFVDAGKLRHFFAQATLSMALDISGVGPRGFMQARPLRYMRFLMDQISNIAGENTTWPEFLAGIETVAGNTFPARVGRMIAAWSGADMRDDECFQIELYAAAQRSISEGKVQADDWERVTGQMYKVTLFWYVMHLLSIPAVRDGDYVSMVRGLALIARLALMPEYGDIVYEARVVNKNGVITSFDERAEYSRLFCAVLMRYSSIRTAGNNIELLDSNGQKINGIAIWKDHVMNKDGILIIQLTPEAAGTNNNSSSDTSSQSGFRGTLTPADTTRFDAQIDEGQVVMIP